MIVQEKNISPSMLREKSLFDQCYTSLKKIKIGKSAIITRVSCKMYNRMCKHDFRCETSFRRRQLIEGDSTTKTFAVMLYCHFSITLLCINVLFDLFLFGIPIFLLNKIRVLPNKLYYAITTVIINWTTPIVFTMPMILSGSKIYCNDINLLLESKAKNSLLLANHGSRIDWMVGMFVGFSKYLAGRPCERIRVGFVCEALIQFMPIVGWYRRIVCHDIFVWRSFQSDALTINANIQDFHKADQRRMLFLSPEGVIVDYGPSDIEYIYACRKFCADQQYEPFDYVLTPRYKGSMSLLQQVQRCNGPVVSICLAYIRDGRLLNCSLLSPDRVVPDIYTLNQGIAGSPVDVYIHVTQMNIKQNMNDPKQFMMENYKQKNKILAEWDKQTKAGITGCKSLMAQYSLIRGDYLECFFFQIAHTVLMTFVALSIGRLYLLFKSFCAIFSIVSCCHTLGWMLNSTSMESVPFETGIKSIALTLSRSKEKRSIVKVN